MKLRNLLALTVASIPNFVFAEGDSPWMPVPGSFGIGVTYTDQVADTFYKTNAETTAVDPSAVKKVISTKYIGNGDQLNPNPDQQYRTTTEYLKVTWGITENFCVDALFGYSSSFARTGPNQPYQDPLSTNYTNIRPASTPDSNKGVMDTMAGFKWRVIDEFAFSSIPTVTLRVNAIIKGSYDPQRLSALGKNSSGYEVAALFGKQFGADFSLAFEVGKQVRGEALNKRSIVYASNPAIPAENKFQIPSATFWEITGDWMFADEWSLYLARSNKTYESNGFDLGSKKYADYRPGFAALSEVRNIAKTGINWAFANNHGVALHLSKVLSGRNTLKDTRISSLSYDFTF